MAHFDLAKFWSGRNEHRRAIRHWTAGHACSSRRSRSRATSTKASSTPISSSSPRLALKAARAPATTIRRRSSSSACRAPAPRCANRSSPRIATLRRRRTGCGAAAYGEAAGDRHDAGQVFRFANLDAATLDKAAAEYLAELHALAPDKARIVDKLPGNYLFLGFIAPLLPKAKFIYCARDPRDIGLSIFTFRFHGSHPYSHDLADIGWTIGQHAKLMDHWRAVLPTGSSP